MRGMVLSFLTVTVLVLGFVAAQPPEGTDKGPGKKGRPPGGGFGGPPAPFAPGRVLPPPVRDQLNLTAEQEKQLDALEKAVSDRLMKILTSTQRQQLHDLRPPRAEGPPVGGPGRPGAPERPPQPPLPMDEPAIDTTQAGIQWFATWESGLREANRRGRPILLVSAAASCAGVSGIW